MKQLIPLGICLAFSTLNAAQADVSAWQPLSGAKWQNWTGLTPQANGQASLSKSEIATYRVPDGPRGSHPVGLSDENDSTLDARPWYGLRFDVLLDRETPLTVDFKISLPPYTGRHDLPDTTMTHIQTQGKGWHTITVPFTSFDYNRGQFYMLKYIKELTIQGKYIGVPGSNRIMLRNMRLVRGNVLHLESAIRSEPADANGAASYPITITNCAETPQSVTLALQKSGWEGMPATVSPTSLSLQPGESKVATVTVTVPSRLPGGARETQTLLATPNGNGSQAETMEFITLRRMPAPYLVFTQDGWDAVKAKVAKYDWAKKDLSEILATADAFEVPIVPPGGIKSDQGTQAVFPSYIEQKLWPCAIAWKLTGDKKYAEKVALFLRRFSDPENGFPKTLHASSQGIPQEGGFLEGSARAYDAIQDAGVLTDADKKQIENTFRIYVHLQTDSLAYGGISNWSVFNLAPAAECALVIQDMEQFYTILYGTGGLIDHLRYGAMDDGWWYEMSLSYNLGCAEAFTNIGLAARPFGIDLLNAHYPVSLTQNVGLRPFEYENFEGMAFGKFGPLKDNTISIKKMWDGIVIYPDYRGIMFGMGDGHEEQVSGGRFEEAYYAYRDPAYASVIKQGSKRDLLFGVPELPTDTPKNYALSGHSDNAGIAVLRSQTANRPQSEQIQASFKYGTHGSYHGHFDRISLNSLERYGRSFFNPETSWFGYGSYLYKWWVQVSVAHNMVVVDGKMQEPKECTPLLFHSGPMLQAVAAETDARWSNPPYFGGYEQIDDVLAGNKPYVPIPKDHPKPTDVTGYTEPVRQRRLMLVTDDYVILADSLKASQSHTFDNLLQLRGAGLADATKAKFLEHTAQFDTNPLSSGQFITNVDRYAFTEPALIHSVHRIADGKRATDSFAGDGTNYETGGARSLSDPGVLNIDAHVLWPQQPEIALANYAESWPVNKRLDYQVQGDGKTLTSGAFGAWILGRGDINVDVTNVKTLTLSTTVDRNGKTLKTIFWGNPVLVTSDGKKIPLSELKTTVSNIDPGLGVGKDYAGGPVRIAGLNYDHAVPGEPQDIKTPGSITVDLTGLNAVRFQSGVGGDWPVGDESQIRKVVSIRSTGTNARFLTLLEPYETKSMIKSATASGPDALHVELTDGRIQDIVIKNLDSDTGNVTATITESKDGKIVRTETASGID